MHYRIIKMEDGIKMTVSIRRGFSPDDGKDFNNSALNKLRYSAEELYFFLNRGYLLKNASTFIGNHYLLTERQRIALTRLVSSENSIAARKEKQKYSDTMAGETVNIDGFNEIITLEVAQSGSPVLLCMDGTYRDLAGLRGTYKIIDKTDFAIRSIFNALRELFVKSAVIWLDAPVSNSGRLKALIADIAEEMDFDSDIEIVNNVDKVLYELPNVITSDSIILDHCESWFNLSQRIVPSIPEAWIIDLNDLGSSEQK